MSEFFESPAPVPEPEEPQYRQPAWFGPPPGTLPGVVPLELVLAQNDRVAVCVSRLAAYSTGFEFEVVTFSAEVYPEFDPMLFHHPSRRRGEPEIPPELLRLGVQFADGSKATNTGGFHPRPGAPPAPVMIGGGGGGGGGRWRQSQWVWPLPPPGPLTLACEWPAADIPLTRHELDAHVILDAAHRAQVIFSDEHLPEPPEDSGDGWATFS